MILKKLIREINDSKIRQTERWDDFKFTTEIDKILSKAQLIATAIDIEKYKSYETSIFVYKFGKKYLGLRLIANRVNKDTFLKDINWTIDAMEMKPFKTTTYIYESNHKQ